MVMVMVAVGVGMLVCVGVCMTVLFRFLEHGFSDPAPAAGLPPPGRWKDGFDQLDGVSNPS
jgi:hypothetical protein